MDSGSLIVDKPLVCQRGLPGRLSTHRPALTLARRSVAAHCASLRVLATSALRASDGQRPGRECIFTANASVCSAKNARNDVHAVISDLSLVLPILCQGSVRSPAFSLAGGCALLKGKIACYTSRCGGYTIHRQMVRQGDSAARQSCQFNNISKKRFSF